MPHKLINKKEILHTNSDSFLADNLRSLLASHSLSANQLAQALNMPIMTIRRLLLSETIDPRISTLKTVADYFGISIDSLIGKNIEIKKHFKIPKPHFVPVLDWRTAANINGVKDLDLSKWEEWQSFPIRETDELSDNAFALKSLPSMYPRFPQGTIFIIDQDVLPNDGDIVLIKIKNNNELSLKKLTIDPPDWFLQSIVSDSNIITYSENDHIIMGINLFSLLYKRNA
jgi:transcriptional regulator with XRE-family HTH domain